MAKPLDASHFRRPRQPALSELPGLPKLAAKMADACAAGLAAAGAAPWRVTSEGVQNNAAPLPEAEGALLRYESERGSLTALLVMDRQVVSALLEAALGGTGAEPAFEMMERPLSKIEKALVKRVRLAVASKVSDALTDALGRPFSLFEGNEAPELDRASGLAQFRFIANVFSFSGEMSLFLAVAELERQLAAAAPQNTSDVMSAEGKLLQKEVGKSEVDMTVALRPERLTVETISNLQPGKVVELTATAMTPVIVLGGEVAAYEGMLGRSGDRFAVTITSELG